MQKKKSGISLIVLIITIIVMIILAGTVMITLYNANIIQKANEAVNETQIASERMIIEQANAVVVAANKGKKAPIEELEQEINNADTGLTVNVMDSGDVTVVRFNESQRCYAIDNSGKISGPEKMIEDEYAGDITKGGTYDGSDEKPYEISCIEDLVAFSKLINNNEIDNTCNVKLTRTLDFKSIFSYNDYEAKYTYDEATTSYLKDENSETTLMELCTNNMGFIPIGGETSAFSGVFNGQGFEIQNIYVNVSGNAGVFGATYQASIQNLGVTGNVTSTGKYAGGIVGNGTWTSYYKCYNKANVSGPDYTGGLVGHGSWGYAEMIECFNSGEINALLGGSAGGLAGSYAGKIINCYNNGSVKSQNSYASGIIEQTMAATEITNCYNIGDIQSEKSIAGGIIGNAYDGTIANNCFNVGEISAPTELTSLSYAQSMGIGAGTANNCYNLGTLKGINIIRTLGADTVNNCYYSSKVATEGETVETGVIDIAGKTMEEFVELLNSYVNDEGVYPTDWKKWKVGNEGYPVFQ